MFFIDFFISIRRIEEFIEQDDVDEGKIEKLETDPFNYALEIQNASFTWKLHQEDKEERKEE